MPSPEARLAPGSRLARVLERATLALKELSEDASARRPAPDKWSPREVLGHLVDSASNNHGRFVRAQLTDDLVVERYAQDEWVAVQRYQELPWSELVRSWHSFNRHLAHVMAAVPVDVARRPRVRHNLHQAAWAAVPADEPTTLGYFMNDYVDHLEHHLRQILGGSWEPGGGA